MRLSTDSCPSFFERTSYSLQTCSWRLFSSSRQGIVDVHTLEEVLCEKGLHQPSMSSILAGVVRCNAALQRIYKAPLRCPGVFGF